MNNHTILERRFPYDLFIDYEEIVRPDHLIGSRSPYFIRLVRSIMFSFYVFFKIISEPGKRRFLFREFDVTAVIFLFVPFKITIVFNINHNMSKCWSRLVCKLLASRYELVFLDAGVEFTAKYPYVSHLDSVVATNSCVGNSVTSVVLVCGSRSEQKEFSDKEYQDIKKSILKLNVPLTVLGKNYELTSFVSEEKLIKIYSSSLVIILFGKKYTDRHSGSLWTAAEYAPCIALPKNRIFENQCRGGARVYVYEDVESIASIVNKVLIRDEVVCGDIHQH